jgi:hypothetical protein
MTGELNLEDASLQLNFLNSFGIEAFMDVREIVGVNNRTGKTVALSTTAFGVPFYLQRGKNIGLSVVPFQYTFFLDKGNSNIKQFLENLPDVIKTKFGVQTEPYWHNNYTDFAFYDSYLKANLELHVPLDLGMKDLRLIKTSPFVLSEPNLQKVQRGNFKLKVKNGYPWEMGAVLEFLDDQGNVIAILGTSEDQKIRPAVVSGSTGRVEGVTETLINMPVTEEKMQWIKNASQIRVSSTFNTDQGKRFKIYSNYKMDIQLIADFVYEN